SAGRIGVITAGDGFGSSGSIVFAVVQAGSVATTGLADGVGIGNILGTGTGGVPWGMTRAAVGITVTTGGGWTSTVGVLAGCHRTRRHPDVGGRLGPAHPGQRRRSGRRERPRRRPGVHEPSRRPGRVRLPVRRVRVLPRRRRPPPVPAVRGRGGVDPRRPGVV